MKELSHYINGEYVKGTSGRFADVYNPATGEIQRKVSLGLASELNEAVKKAKKVSQHGVQLILKKGQELL